MASVERVPLERLTTWPGNPRKGNKRLIRESLREFGQTRPLHVRRDGNVVMFGNNTLECMREMGLTHADVVYHDVDEGTARRMSLMDNRTVDFSLYDDGMLAEMLQQLDGDYAGSGWTEDEADRVYARLEDNSQEFWELDGEEEHEPAVEIEHIASTGAAYAENPLAEAARAERQAQQVTHVVAGTRELVLVYSNEEHAEVIRLLGVLRTLLGTELRAPQIVYRLLQEAAGNAAG